jgi:hypothetical protein
LDPVENLATSKAYIFAGREDGTVAPSLADELYSYYSSFMSRENIKLENSLYVVSKSKQLMIATPIYRDMGEIDSLIWFSN